MMIKPLEQTYHFGGGGTVFAGLCRILVYLFLRHADMDITESKFPHVFLYCFGLAAMPEKEFACIITTFG